MHLIEAILAAVTDIHDLDHLRYQSLVEHVALTELRLEVCTSSQDNASDVDLVIRDEVLHSVLGDFANVVVAFFITKTGETKGGLTTSTMLLR